MALRDVKTFTAARRRFVLIADSDSRRLLALSAILKRFEYDVLTAGAASEVLEIAAVVDPVLVVTAQSLGAGKTGLDIIKAFRSRKPPCPVPCIVLIGKADPPFERACLSAGALVCLHAPVSVENLYRVVQVAVEPVPRMTIRISANLPAAICDHAVESGNKECVQAISENGAYIRTPELYPINTRLPVRIKFSDGVMAVDAKVIYTSREDDDRKGTTGMGLQFVGISQQDQERIRMFIRREMSRGISPLRPAR